MFKAYPHPKQMAEPLNQACGQMSTAGLEGAGIR